jgi:PST family polysaccharide transporter
MNPRKEGSPVQYVAWLIGERLVRGAVTVVALAAVARHLAPSGFGVLNYANAVVGLAVPLAQLGLDTILVRELVKNPGRTGTLLGTAFCLRLVAGVFFAGLLLGSSQLFSIIGSAQPALGPMSIIIVAQAGEVVDCWFKSQIQSRTVVVIRGGVVIASAGVKLVLVAMNAGLVSFAWVYAIEAVTYASVLIMFSRLRYKHLPPWSFDVKLARVLVFEAWGFALASFLAALAVRLDQLSVTGMLGEAPAGLYFGALRLMEFPLLIATATSVSLIPEMARAFDAEALENKLEVIFGIMSAIAWMTAIGTTLVGPWLVVHLLGKAYSGSWSVLIILAWSTLFYFPGLIRANFLAMRSASATQAATALGSLGVQSVLVYLLVPRFGISGAAFSFLITQFVGTWAFPLLLPKLRPCWKPQAIAVFAPWQVKRWRSFVMLLSR